MRRRSHPARSRNRVFCGLTPSLYFAICVALLALPTGAMAQDASNPSPARPIHIVPFGPPKKRPAPAATTEPVVQYWGGPVISNIHIVEVLWGSFVDVPSTTGLSQYFTDVTNSNYFDLLSEYGTVGIAGQGGATGSNQLIGRGTFDGKFVITPSLCPGSAAIPPP